MRTSSLFLGFFLAVSVGCASPSADDTESGSGAATAAPSSELLGTWDVLMVTDSGPDQATLKLDEKSITFDSADQHIQWNVDGSVILGEGRSMGDTLKVDHKATTTDFGIFPYKLGGNWKFSDQGNGSCEAKLADGSASVSCVNSGYPTSEAFLEGTPTTMKRTAKRESRFGALGGVWTVKGSNYAFDITFEGSTFRLAARTDDGRHEGIDLEFGNGNGRASGSISGAGEISAQKR